MSGIEIFGGVAGIVSIVLVVGREIISRINHKRFVSKCCDKEVSVSVDIEATTPKENAKSEEVATRRPSLADKWLDVDTPDFGFPNHIHTISEYESKDSFVWTIYLTF